MEQWSYRGSLLQYCDVLSTATGTAKVGRGEVRGVRLVHPLWITYKLLRLRIPTPYTHSSINFYPLAVLSMKSC